MRRRWRSDIRHRGRLSSLDAENVGVVAGLPARRLDDEPVVEQLPLERLIRTQHPDGLYLVRPQPLERLDDRMLARPAHDRGIQYTALHRESHVLAAVGRLLRFIVFATPRDLGGAFSVGDPGGGPVDRFAVDRQPRAHSPQQLPGLLGQRAVRLGPDVQQQRTVLADVVDQVVHELGGRLVGGLLEVAPPRTIVDGRVGDPLVVGQLVHASQLQVHHACPGGRS